MQHVKDADVTKKKKQLRLASRLVKYVMLSAKTKNGTCCKGESKNTSCSKEKTSCSKEKTSCNKEKTSCSKEKTSCSKEKKSEKKSCSKKEVKKCCKSKENNK